MPGQQLVLGAKEVVPLTQAFALGEDVLAVRREFFGDLAPGHAVVAPQGGALVVGGRLLDHRLAVPGRPEHHCGRAGCGCHWAKLAVEPVHIDVLRFVRNDGDGRRMARDVSLRVGPEVGRCRPPVPDVVPLGPKFPRDVDEAAEDVHRTLMGDECLRRERRCCYHHAPTDIGMSHEQAGDQHPCDFVLPRLAGKHDGIGAAALLDHPAMDANEGRPLVGTQAHEGMLGHYRRTALLVASVAGQRASQAGPTGTRGGANWPETGQFMPETMAR